MKLLSVLFLTIAAQTHAEDDLPNLRGVVGIALTNGDGEEFRGPVGISCRKLDEHCSTSPTTLAKFHCCGIGEEGTTEELTCTPNSSVSILSVFSHPHYNGKCVATTSAPGEIDE